MSAEHKYYGFEPAMSGNATFGIERIEDVGDELKVLWREHYNETEVLYLNEEFNPDVDRYKAQEEAGQYVAFTVRIGKRLVGYLQYWVFRDMHSQGMYVAREDAFFITKEYRGHKLAPKLLNYAESALVHLGCKYVGMTSKEPVGGPDIGGFLEKRGYRPVAMYFMKKLDGT